MGAGPVIAAPVAVAGLCLSGLTDVAARLGYALPLVGVGAESAGLPVPGETTLLVSAVLAGDGRLTPWGVALAGFAGAVLGDNLGYWAGRRFGMRLARLPVLRRLYTPDRLAAAQRLSAGRGAFAAVFLARFAVMLRVLGGPLAGMHRMPWPRFLVANAAGAAVWTGLIVTLGLLIGDNLHRAHALLTWVGLAGLAVATFSLVTMVVLARRRRRSHRGERSTEAGRNAGSWPPRQTSLTVPARANGVHLPARPGLNSAGLDDDHRRITDSSRA